MKKKEEIVNIKRWIEIMKRTENELFRIALKKYDAKQSELINEIVHAWLFSNKLQLKK